MLYQQIRKIARGLQTKLNLFYASQTKPLLPVFIRVEGRKLGHASSATSHHFASPRGKYLRRSRKGLAQRR